MTLEKEITWNEFPVCTILGMSQNCRRWFKLIKTERHNLPGLKNQRAESGTTTATRKKEFQEQKKAK